MTETANPAVSRQAPDTLDIAIGAAIRLRRRHAGISQEMLAEKCGVSFQQVQKYENGVNRVSFSRLVQIAHALGLRVSELVGDIDEATGLSPAESGMLTDLGVPGAIDLLRDYAGLSPALRGRVRDLLREIAESQRG
jgi:transcriptional regulator with XRE-family HTH domain